MSKEKKETKHPGGGAGRADCAALSTTGGIRIKKKDWMYSREGEPETSGPLFSTRQFVSLQRTKDGILQIGATHEPAASGPHG